VPELTTSSVQTARADTPAAARRDLPLTQLAVLLVLEYSGSSHWALWEAVASLGVDLHIVASLDQPIAPAIPFSLEPPTFGTFDPLSLRRVRGDRHTWWQYKGLGRLIDRVRPDLLHLKTEPWSLITGQALRTKVPTVVHGAETLYEQGRTAEREMRRLVARRNLRRLDGFVGWSTAAVSAARCGGLPSHMPVLVAPAEIPDPGVFRGAAALRAATRKELGFGNDFVVGFVGRYVPGKGLAWLLDAFGAITPIGTQLAFFGSGPDASLIRAACNRTQGRVRDFGAVPQPAVGRSLAALDVLVVPSTTVPAWAEQFGRVTVEAMLTGVPVVASRSGALPEVLGGSGLLVDEFDVEGLSAALDRLKQDREFRLALGLAGRDHALAAFEPRTVAERLVRYWRHIVGRSLGE